MCDGRDLSLYKNRFEKVISLDVIVTSGDCLVMHIAMDGEWRLTVPAIYHK